MFVRRARVRPSSAASTSATSCSSRTSTSAGASTCSATGCASRPTRSPTTSTTRSMKSLRRVPRDVPARAQRALHALQEPRRRGLGNFLPGALALLARRAVAKGGLDSEPFDIRVHRRGRRARPDDPGARRRPSPALFALDQFVEDLPDARSRPATRSRRRRVKTDSRRVPAVRRHLHAARSATTTTSRAHARSSTRSTSAEPTDAHARARHHRRPDRRRRWPGPAIRAWNMAEALSEHSDVRLVTWNVANRRLGPVRGRARAACRTSAP